MPRNFQLTAQLNLQAPKNINQVVSNIRKQLKSVTMNVDIKINNNTLGKIRQLNQQIQTLSTNIKAVTASSQGLNTLSAGLRGVGNALGTTTTAIKKQSAALKQTTKDIEEAKTEMEAFGSQSALAIRRFAAFSIATTGIIGFTVAIKNGFKEAIAFDKEMVRLSQVTGKSVASLRDVSDEIGRLAQKFGVSSTELLEVSSTLAQAGLSARDTKIALEALAKSSLAPSFDDIRQTTEGVIAVMRQFNIQASEVEAALGSINAVAAAYAAESQDLIAAVRISGGVFAAASEGVAEGTDALNQFIAIITSVRQTTRESAESIATGLRTIFTRIQRPRTIEYLREFGVELTDFEGKFVGPYEAIRRLSAGLKDLDTRDANFARISEEIGGYRQLGKTIPLIKQFAVAQEAYQVAQDGSNSLAKDAITAQQSLANQFAKTEERFLALIRTIAQSSTFNNLAAFVLKTADGFLRLAEAIEPVLPYLTILAGIKFSSAALQFGSGFLGGIRGATPKKGFNNGGLVPGVGNSDTYPTTLTPGEYVIRKDAVKAIGVNNLAKFNQAGIVKGTQGTSPKSIAKFLRGKGRSLGFEELTEKSIAELSTSQNPDDIALYRSILTAKAGGTGSKKPISKGKTVAKFTPPKDINAKDLIAKGEYGGLFFQLGTKNISTALVPVSTAKISDKAVAQLKGVNRVFGQPKQFFLDKGKANKFDARAKNIFDDNIRGILNTGGSISVMAKALGKSPDEVVEDVKKQVGFETFAGGLFEAYISSLTNQINPDRSRGFDFKPVSPLFSNLFGDGINGVQFADAKLTSDNKSRQSLVKKAVNVALDGDSRIRLEPYGKDNIKEYRAQAQKIVAGAGTNIRRKAMGGGIGGTDTVPALLTPGEYVFNKEAVDRIGLPTLERMNKVQKFASGGFVRGFEDGGNEGTPLRTVSSIGTKEQASIVKLLKQFELETEEAFYAIGEVVQEMQKTGASSKEAAKKVAAEIKATKAKYENQTMIDKGSSTGLDPAKAPTGLGGIPFVPPSQVPATTSSGNGVNRLSTMGTKEVAYVQEQLKKAGVALSDLPMAVEMVEREMRSLEMSAKLASQKVAKQVAIQRTLGGKQALNPARVQDADLDIQDQVNSGIGINTYGSADKQNVRNARKKRGIFRTASLRAKAGLQSGKIGRGVLAGYDVAKRNAAGVGVTGALLAAEPLRDAIGSETPTRAGVGGGLSGALSGAALGSAFGPLGTIGGGLIGGASGFLDGKKQAILAKEMDKLAKSTEQADKAMSKLATGDITDAEVSSSIEGQFRNSINSGNSLFEGIGRNDLYGGGITGAALGAFNRLPIVGDTEAEFQIRQNAEREKRRNSQFEAQSGAGEKAADFFQSRFRRGKFGVDKDSQGALAALAVSGSNAKSNSDYLSNFSGVERVKKAQELGQKELDRLANKFQKEVVKSETAASKAAIAIELLGRSFEKVSAGVVRAAADNEKYTISIENQINAFNDTFSVGRTASQAGAFSNPDAYSTKEITAASERLTKGFLPEDISSKFTDTLTSTKALQEGLPTFLLEQYGGGKNQSTLDLKDGIGDYIDKLKTQGINVSPEITQSLFRQADLQKGKEAGAQNFDTYIREQLSKDIAELGEGARKAAEDLTKGLEQANSTYLAGINQYIQVQLEADKQRAAFTGNKAARENELISGFGQRKLTADERAAPQESRIRQLAGIGGKGILDADFVGGIASQNAGARSRLAELQKERAGLAPNETDKILENEKAQAAQNSLLAKNTEALKGVVDSSDRLAAIQEEFADIEAAKQGGRDLGLKLLRASPAEKRDLQKQIGGAAALEAGQYGKGSLVNNRDAQELIAKGIQLNAGTIRDDAAREKYVREQETKLFEAAGGDINSLPQNRLGQYIKNGFTELTPEQQKAKEEAGKIQGGRNAAEEELLKKFDKLPEMLNTLDAQLKAMVDDIRTNTIKAFRGMDGAETKALASAVNNFNSAVAGMPKTITHTVEPVTVNVNVTGVEGLDARMTEIATNLLNKLPKNTLPLVAQIENGRALNA